MVDLRIEKVENGYTVHVGKFEPNNAMVSDTCYVAATQDAVATVTKQIIRGAFDSEGKVEVEVVVVDGYPVTKKVKADA